MKLKNILAAAAASGLIFAPLAAQAGTAASASMPKSSVSDVASRRSSSVSEDQRMAPGLLIAVVLAAGAAAYGLSKALDNNNKSHGAN